MKWFLVVLIYGQPADTGASLANFRYASRAECWANAPERVGALASVGWHGRFTCMRERMPDAELRRQPRAEF